MVCAFDSHSGVMLAILTGNSRGKPACSSSGVHRRIASIGRFLLSVVVSTSSINENWRLISRVAPGGRVCVHHQKHAHSLSTTGCCWGAAFHNGDKDSKETHINYVDLRRLEDVAFDGVRDVQFVLASWRCPCDDCIIFRGPVWALTLRLSWTNT